MTRIVSPNIPDRPVLFYDGACGMCDQVVRFMLARDRRGTLLFAPLQGTRGRACLLAAGKDPDTLDTVHMLLPSGELLDRSRAVAAALGQLGWPWRALSLFRVLPRALTDRVYDLVARNRHHWFKAPACALVTDPAVRARFLESTDDARGPAPP